MRIRDEQIQTLTAGGERSFHDRMVGHLHTYFPQHCAGLGKAGVREAIQHGIARAQTYQIITERDVCKYISLMFAFGRDFDVDPALPWAAGILQNKSYARGTERLEALYRTAKRRVQQAARRTGR